MAGFWSKSHTLSTPHFMGLPHFFRAALHPNRGLYYFYLCLVFQQMKQDSNAKYVGRTLVGCLLLYYNYPALSSEVGFCDRVTFSVALEKIIIG